MTCKEKCLVLIQNVLSSSVDVNVQIKLFHFTVEVRRGQYQLPDPSSPLLNITLRRSCATGFPNSSYHHQI